MVSSKGKRPQYIQAFFLDVKEGLKLGKGKENPKRGAGDKIKILT